MKKNSKKVFLVSLGCSKNLVDTEVIAGTLLTAGHTLAFDPDEADLYIVNSCAFIPAARTEAEEALDEGVAWKKEEAGRTLVLAGCLTEWDKVGAYRKRYPEVDLWTGVNDVAAIAALVAGEAAPDPTVVPTWLYDHETPRLQLTVPHLAYLKIADGCDNCCSYCAIPGIRGHMRSRTTASVLREAKNLIDGGVKELLIIAQDITAFGMDRPESGETLAKLLKELNALEGKFVIRLLYTHPAHYTPELIDFLAEKETKILPYLDIPLQHISDRILKEMGRKVTKKEIETLLAELRKRIPDLTLRTTFITGFPGETEEEFAELAAFLKEQKFERCGVFSYSPEPGTPAAEMANQVPLETAEKRAEKLMKQQEKIMKECNRRWIGREVRVLIDDTEDGSAIGRGPMDAPEIDDTVFIPRGKKLKPGRFCKVRITGADAWQFTGELLQ